MEAKLFNATGKFSFGNVVNAVSSLEVVGSVQQRLDDWLEEAKQISVQITTNKDPSVTPGRVMSENCLKSGYLLRRRPNRAAERIFCVLKPSTKLYLFQTPDDVEPREVIDIERIADCVVERVDEIEESDDYDYDLSYLSSSPVASFQVDNIKHLFIIHKPSTSKDKSKLNVEFEATTEIDANDWVSAITSDSYYRVRMERDELVKATHLLLDELKRIESRNESLEEFADQRHSAVKEALLLKSQNAEFNSSVKKSIDDLSKAVSNACSTFSQSSTSIDGYCKGDGDLCSELTFLSSSAMNILNWMTVSLSRKIDDLNAMTESRHETEDELTLCKRISENQAIENDNMREQICKLSIQLTCIGSNSQVEVVKRRLAKSESKRRRLVNALRNNIEISDWKVREEVDIPVSVFTSREEFREMLRSDFRERISKLSVDDDDVMMMDHDQPQSTLNLEPVLNLSEVEIATLTPKLVEKEILPQTPTRTTPSSLFNDFLSSATSILTPIVPDIKKRYKVTFRRKHLGIKLVKANHPTTGTSCVMVSAVGIPPTDGDVSDCDDSQLVVIGSVLVSCNGSSLFDLTFKQVASILISSTRPVDLEFEEFSSNAAVGAGNQIKDWLNRAVVK